MLSIPFIPSHRFGGECTFSPRQMKDSKQILILMGTRPEVIKLAPVVLSMKRISALAPLLCLTGQHAQMAEQMLGHFGLKADIAFEVPRKVGNLTALVAGMASKLAGYIRKNRPDMIIVQGDTTSAMIGAMAGFYERIPVAHVEAGLRSFDLSQPFPEEFNRRVISIGADLNFCPTRVSASNLLAEGVSKKAIHVVGNTCIDALLWTLQKHRAPKAFTPGTRGILATAHRRENWSGGIARLCGVLKKIARRFPDTETLFPVHRNPIVRDIINNELSGLPQVRLVDPMGYCEFAWAMKEAFLIISDSGGVQEEALALGTPVLVARDVTERPEVLKGGTVQLTGTSPDKLWKAARRLLADPQAYRLASVARFPFGRGDAAGKITSAIGRHLARD